MLVKVTFSNMEHRKWNLRYILWVIKTVFKQIQTFETILFFVI